MIPDPKVIEMKSTVQRNLGYSLKDYLENYYFHSYRFFFLYWYQTENTENTSLILMKG